MIQSSAGGDGGDSKDEGDDDDDDDNNNGHGSWSHDGLFPSRLPWRWLRLCCSKCGCD